MNFYWLRLWPIALKWMISAQSPSLDRRKMMFAQSGWYKWPSSFSPNASVHYSWIIEQHPIQCNNDIMLQDVAKYNSWRRIIEQHPVKWIHGRWICKWEENWWMLLYNPFCFKNFIIMQQIQIHHHICPTFVLIFLWWYWHRVCGVHQSRYFKKKWWCSIEWDGAGSTSTSLSSTELHATGL